MVEKYEQVAGGRADKKVSWVNRNCLCDVI